MPGRSTRGTILEDRPSACTTDASPTRPVLRYHGGKWRAAPWILSHFPAHRVYAEPYGGAASLLFQKPRVYAEIYNDLDAEIVNVFRVLRDPRTSADLERLIRLTPFARDEFEAAYEPCGESVEQARRTVLKAFAGHGSDSIHRGSAAHAGMLTRPSRWNPGTGFRSDSTSGTTAAKGWAHYPEQISRFCSRLAGVVIEHRPALRVIEQYDYADTLFYVDPPYVRSSRRDATHGYRHEMTDDQHRELAAVLRSIRGMAIVSGYACHLYDKELYPDWRRAELAVRTLGDGHGAVEVLWMSPKVRAREPSLFDATGDDANWEGS